MDFADSALLFEGRMLTQEDDRFDYGETRFQTYGLLDGRLIIVVWTQRREARHIISMRKCNEREKRKVTHRLAQG
ncbi:MAG TPA: BrnT family toxin [Rhizomicrobium sp.]|nr:BrnT family toxin [Rhizomicrobium sp.]